MKSNSQRTSPERQQLSGESQKSLFARQAQPSVIQRQTSRKSQHSSSSERLEMLEKEIADAPLDGLTLVSLLKRNISIPQARDLICEKLMELTDTQIQDYILELVYLMIKHDIQNLERLLLVKCSASISMYLLVKWIYEAFTNNERGEKGPSAKVEQMDRRIEESMVNSSTLYSQTEQNIFAYFDKEHRSNYVDSIHIFVNNLVKISLTLKTIPAEERSFQLRKFLIKANRSLVSYRLNNPGVIYCQGIVLPFQDDESNSNLVVRIIESDCQSFRTKKRVPYKILVETIDMQELKMAVPELKKQQSDYDQQPLADEGHCSSQSFDKSILEDFMAQTSKDKAAIQQMAKHNAKRFNLLFPPQRIQQRLSCSGRLQHNDFKNKKQNCHFEYEIVEKNKLNNFRRKHKRYQDLSSKSKVKFIRKLMKERPLKEHKLIHIFHTLGYDIQEKSIEQDKIRHIKLQQERTKYNLCADGLKPFQEVWLERVCQIQENSPYGHFLTYRLRPLVVKGGDDLRQELMVMKLLRICETLFQGTSLFLKTYEIIVTSVDSGIIEFCVETMSIDALKKRMIHLKGLKAIYDELYPDFEEAQKNFVDSLAAYSVVQYLFQIKDRHNGNILIDSQGHLIHIDFGFILCVSPGGINFENVPFKLTKEYLELMGGKSSDMFNYFKQKLFLGFVTLQKHADQFFQILNIMRYESDLPCFEKFDQKVFRDRFMETLDQDDLMHQVEKLVYDSMENTRTVLYDNFQKLTNGILP